MIVGSVLLYKKRKSECAESNFAFPIPKIMIRFIVTAVTGLGMGLLFHMSISSPSSFFIGVAAGSLAAHIVVEAVYSRGFKQMKRSFGWYGIFVALFIVIYGVLATGFFGYDMRLPNADDVESISITAANQYYSSDDQIYNEDFRQVIATVVPTLKDRENINQMLKLHKEFLSTNRNTVYPYSMKTRQNSPFTIEYHLKNGTVMKRTYFSENSYDNAKEVGNGYDNLLNQAVKMEEYIKSRDILFYLEPEYLKSIDISIGDNTLTIAPDKTVKAELLEALKADSLSGQINDPNTEHQKLNSSILITCKEKIDPTGRLKELLGGYSGKICISKNSYLLSDGAEKTNALIKKYGWDK